jgi:hypothetical protein
MLFYIKILKYYIMARNKQTYFHFMKVIYHA